MDTTDLQVAPLTGSPNSDHSDSDVTGTLLKQLAGELGEGPAYSDTKMDDAPVLNQATAATAPIPQSQTILASETPISIKPEANNASIDSTPIATDDNTQEGQINDAPDSQKTIGGTALVEIQSDTVAQELHSEKNIADTSDGVVEPLEQAANAVSDLPDTQMKDAANVDGTAEENNQVTNGSENPDSLEEPAEWEEDSDPISSSDSSDSSDSDSDSDEGDDAFKRLTPAEQARILMADGGSDDEDGPKKGTKEPLQTKNEVTEAVLPKPDITITPEMKIQELGEVMTVVGGTTTTVTIRAGTSGDIPRLDSGSILCLEDRTVVAAIADTFGPVAQPFYITRFTNVEEVTKLGLAIGTRIFYSEQHAKFVFPSDMRKMKWTDASNIHDEEVNDVEMEFSDDEKEAEYKARRKANNRDKARGGKMQGDGGERGRGRGRGDRSRGGRGGRFIQQGPQSSNNNSALNYDDEGDNLYNPLQRPAHFAANTGRGEPPQEQPYGSNKTASVRGGYSRYGGDQHNTHNTNRGSFASRGTLGNHSGNTSLPPQPNYNSPQGQYQSFPRPPSQSGASPQTPQWPQFPPQQPNMQYMAPGMPPPFMMPGFPNMPFPPPPSMPSGGFINPNFFPNQPHPQYPQQQPQQGQPGQQGQQNQQSNQTQYSQQKQNNNQYQTR